MAESEPSIYDDIDEQLDELENLAKAGHPEVAGAIRALGTFKGLLHDFDEGNTFSNWLVDVVAPLIAALKAASRPASPTSSDEFARLARTLAADILEIEQDSENYQFDYHDVMKLKHDARRLLTGVDVGPYSREDDQTS